MKIYTKTGDRGTTARYGGTRLSKASPAIEAEGALDELTSFIGLTATHLTHEVEVHKLLESIQHDLYEIMAVIAGSVEPVERQKSRTQEFERLIDHYTSGLPELHAFIMPGGTTMSGWMHVLRAVTRRAERAVVRLAEDENADVLFSGPAPYLNRLSDLFFTLARHYNQEHEVQMGKK